VILDCPVEDFAQKVQSQHSFIACGDVTGEIEELCRLLGLHILGDAEGAA